MRADEYIERYATRLFTDIASARDACAEIGAELIAEIKQISRERYKMHGDNVHLGAVREIFAKSTAIARKLNKRSPGWIIDDDWLRGSFSGLAEQLSALDKAEYLEYLGRQYGDRSPQHIDAMLKATSVFRQSRQEKE